MESLDLSSQDWQIGYTKIFFRQRCFDPLEDMRRSITHAGATKIQATWRMCVARTEFVHVKSLVVWVQQRYAIFIAKVRERKRLQACIVIQSYYRGWRVRKR